MTDLTTLRRTVLAGTVLAAGLVGVPALAVAQSGELNLYSSRHYDTDEELYANFTEADRHQPIKPHRGGRRSS